MQGCADTLMVDPGIVADSRHWGGGSFMRRVFVIAVAGASLAGCSSPRTSLPRPPCRFSSSRCRKEPKPAHPSGRVARHHAPSPCADAGFTVTYALNKFQPVTIPVQVIHSPGDFSSPASTAIDPNPVVAELEPAGPAAKAAHTTQKPKKPKPPETTAGAAAPAGSPFPNPAQVPPPPAAPSR